ncbi:hypothetical protein [Oscillatoria acuminata]|uniref:Uncharacterized protein n=1 Tax=Oscillatoria acuminata PCC 6304 TaxID=56110 RepID=K9TCM8_9CYAN|nr:hypothetical protein [Oscillatoria acuminata]AFY80265.1 hypothetical protein Oscil6304_0519 [Oscillatoria acuminata PCC 6304]
MPTHSHTQAVLDHYQRALTFCPQPAKIQERIAGLHWTLWDIPQEMVQFLQKSWNYSPYLPVETVVHWVESFAEFSRDVGEGFDRDRLTQLPEWEGLIRWAIGGKRFEQRNSATPH